VTLVRKGLIDHADSLGAAARFGEGDVQWLTAGQGIQHSEMFPLLHRDQANPLELFQIWLNLPAARKMVAPHFTMLWSERIPRLVHTSDGGARTTVTVVAGALPGAGPLPPPPESWAGQADADVAIWTLRLEPGARWTLPAAQGAQTRRMLYWFVGQQLQVAGDRCANMRRWKWPPARTGCWRTPAAMWRSCCCCKAGRLPNPWCSTDRS
jgi:redox-sensitive bicupin YhaK (pirin superfamily)